MGLGNPGEEYNKNRHNIGKMFLCALQEEGDFSDWKNEKMNKSSSSTGEIDGKKVKLVIPEVYVNSSGEVAKKYIKNSSARKKLIVVQDELDIPVGAFKVSYDRGAGGHKGILSIQKAIKGTDFYRIRVGISSATRGKIQKPKGGEAVKKHVLSNFSNSEIKKIEELWPQIEEILGEIVKGER